MEPPSWVILICPWCNTRGMFHPDGDTVHCQSPQCGRPFKVSEGIKDSRQEPEHDPDRNGRIDGIEEMLRKQQEELREHDREIMETKVYKTFVRWLLGVIAVGLIAAAIGKLLN